VLYGIGVVRGIINPYGICQLEHERAQPLKVKSIALIVFLQLHFKPHLCKIKQLFSKLDHL